MNTQLATVLLLRLEELSDEQISALNNAVQSFGRVSPQNIAFQICVENKLINRDGSLLDVEAMRDACACEALRRFPRDAPSS